MAQRQQQKSQQTRAELKTAALELIRENGYEATAVADIVARAGYSVGAFYGHFKTKQELTAELWIEYITGEMERSTREGLAYDSFEELIDYLIQRGDEVYKNPYFYQLQQPCVFTHENIKAMRETAAKYSDMLRRSLARQWPEADESVVSTCADIIHCLLNAYTERKLKPPYFGFDRANMKSSLLFIAQMCAPEQNRT